MKENRIKNLLIVLNIASWFLIIGFFYADFSYILQPYRRVPEPIKEAIKPVEKNLEFFNKTDEAVKTIVVNIIPEKEEKPPAYINYISNAVNIFLHNSLFLLFFSIPIVIEYLPSLCKFFKWRIDKRYEKAEKIGEILLIIALLTNLSLNCFYIGLGLRIFRFAFFYFFEFFALIFTVFPVINYLRNNDFNEYINDLKFSIPLMLSLFFAGAFEESVYLVK